MTSPMLLPLRRYADFRRRASRSEYWLFVLFLIVASSICVAIDEATGLGGQVSGDWWTYGWGAGAAAQFTGGILTRLFSLAMLIPAFAVSVRRLHDTNRSGWWLMIGFVPLVGWLALLFFYVQPSWPLANRWGAPAGAVDQA